MSSIRYRSGYRYQLEDTYQIQTGIVPIDGMPGNRFVGLAPDGLLTIAAGYAWNGANKPAINDVAFVRPSLVHDACCQLWDLGAIDDAGRAAADKLLGRMLRDDMQVIARRLPWAAKQAVIALSYIRPLWVEGAVRWYSTHMSGRTQEEILTAP